MRNWPKSVCGNWPLWPPVASRGLPWPSVTSRGFPLPLMASRVLPWPPLGPRGLPWPPLGSRGLWWPPVASCCLPRSVVVSPGVPWPPVASVTCCGLLASRGFSWSPVVSRGLQWPLALLSDYFSALRLSRFGCKNFLLTPTLLSSTNFVWGHWLVSFIFALFI